MQPSRVAFTQHKNQEWNKDGDESDAKHATMILKSSVGRRHPSHQRFIHTTCWRNDPVSALQTKKNVPRHKKCASVAPLGTGQTHAMHSDNSYTLWIIRNPVLDLNISFFFFLFSSKDVALSSPLQPESKHCRQKLVTAWFQCRR